MPAADAPSDRVKSGSTQYLTATTVADMLEVDAATVYRWAASDPSMPATRIGSTIRFRVDRLERWLEERTQSVRSRRRQAHIQPQHQGASPGAA
jgi:excisionase family DNA binding protein